MYKLIVVDLDGTLLNSYGEISERNKKAISKCIENKVEVVLASGRPIDSMKNIAQELGIKGYFIAGNGALIYNTEEEKIIYENCIKKEKVLQIIEICEENSIVYNLYTENIVLTTNLKFNVLYYYKENLKKEENKKTNISVVENMYEYVKNMQNENILKITICDKDEVIFKSIVRKIKEINDIEVLEISHMSKKTIIHGTEEIPVEYFYTEISAINVNKWNAVEFLMKNMQLKKEEIIAIGDNVNDKRIIENAGLGIAVKDSTPEIINIADEVTETNDNNGVARILEKYIL